MEQELALSDYRAYACNNFSFLKLSTISKHFRMVAEALSHVHALGYAHNDVKLENILYFDSNTVKLADFGYAHQVQADNAKNNVEVQ